MLDNHMTLKELLNAKEGEHIQFKEAKNRFEFNEAAKCCCALANCGGGKLVFGVSDKRPRMIVGSTAFNQPERTRLGLIDKLKIMVDFELYECDGKRVLVFDVAGRPHGLAVQVDGVAWWYDADSLVPMPDEIRYKIYAEIGVDFSSIVCKSAKITDLDETAIEKFRDKWIEKSHNKRLSTLTHPQLLHDCEAVTNEGITYAALILFGKKEALIKYLPQSEIVFEYRSSNASGPANQREELRMGFFSCYDRLWELVNLRNDIQHYQEGFFVFDIPTFNERAVREAILNAVSHRNYQLAGSVFIRQFERSGQGMNIIYESCVKEAKQLPDFTGTDDNFVCLTLSGLVLDKKMLSVIKKIGNERLDNLSTVDFLVIDALYHERKINGYTQGRLKRLTEMGLVEHIGRNKYVLARSLYTAAGKRGVHTRVIGLDRDTNKELLYKHIRDSKGSGTPFKELQQVLPSLSRGQIQVLLRELRKENRIHVIGTTSAARWFSDSIPTEND